MPPKKVLAVISQSKTLSVQCRYGFLEKENIKEAKAVV